MKSVPSARASEVSFNEALIRLAAINKRDVKFRYAKTTESPIETRTFTPEGVYKTAPGHTVFVGPDPDRGGEYRTYRLDRILGDVTL